MWGNGEISGDLQKLPFKTPTLVTILFAEHQYLWSGCTNAPNLEQIWLTDLHP